MLNIVILMDDIWVYVHLKQLQTAQGLLLVCIWDNQVVCLKPEYTSELPSKFEW